jgi:small subunit ribosomal protein S6
MKYEVTLILDAQLEDSQIESEIKKVEGFLSKNCESLNKIQWGKRRLAYPIKKRQHGFYTIFEFDTKKQIIAELERSFRINENVLRYLTIKP